MLTGKTAPPTPAEVADAEAVLATVEPEVIDAVRVVVRDEMRPVVRRVGRELAGWMLLLTLLLVGGMARTENAAGTATAAANRVGRESVERQVDGCYRTNEFRRVYREDLARRATPLDPAQVRALPEYQALPAEVRPIVDLFLETIAGARLDAAEVSSRYEADFPLVDCAALRLELEREP